MALKNRIPNPVTTVEDLRNQNNPKTRTSKIGTDTVHVEKNFSQLWGKVLHITKNYHNPQGDPKITTSSKRNVKKFRNFLISL